VANSPDRRAPSTQAAWIVAAAAMVLAVVLAVVAARAAPDPVPGAMHSNSGPGMVRGGHADMMQSLSMMSADEGDYLVEMLAHHDEAVAAATELSRSDRSEVRELGNAIVTSQTAQMVQMRSWLEQWHEDTGPAAYEPMMRDLSGLTGDDLDQAFLEDMVMHHWMAVMMSRHVLTGSADLHPEVADLARDIVREQSAEIRQMRRWLADWFGVWAGMGSGPPMVSRTPS